MTAATVLPRRSGRRTYPAARYVECPVCHKPTGTMTHPGGGSAGFLIVLDPTTASGPADGTRCKAHARTEEQRAAETATALGWLHNRMVDAAWPGDIS